MEVIALVIGALALFSLAAIERHLRRIAAALTTPPAAPKEGEPHA